MSTRIDPMLDRTDRRDDPEPWSSEASGGMVVSAHYRATEAGVEMLLAGGNAVDAAVACSLALGVVEGSGSGLGGMTMMIVHLASSGRTFAIEGPCRAPKRATPEQVARPPRRWGHRAVAVPTNVATLAYALNRYGHLSPRQVIVPALRLARDGYVVTPYQHLHTLEERDGLLKRNAGSVYLRSDGEVPAAGSVFVQPALARTLERLADAGFEDFYAGDIARAIAADMERSGGFIRADDLADIPWPRETDPVPGEFRGLQVRSLAPPGGGSVLVQMLRMWDILAPDGLDPDSAEAVVLLASIIRRARRDRRHNPPGKEGVADLASPEHAREAVRQVRDGSGETSHLSVMDREGNSVALTQSIERTFGARVLTKELGFLYNGYMRTFKVQNRSHPFFLRPGLGARSNASPTILLDHGKPVITVGSTGSERMVSGIFQCLVRLGPQSPFDAVRAPRLHSTPESVVLIEQERFDPAVIEALVDAGFQIQPLEAWAFKAGGLHLVVSSDERFFGAADPRRDGSALGR